MPKPCSLPVSSAYRWTILRAMPSPTPSIHNTEPITMDDVIIIGGSFAGLAGALQLGRARRKVTVLDTGLPGPIAAGAARAGVLARQAARQKTGQVSVNFPGRHVTCRRQFSQRDWPLRARKMVEELTGDLDGYRYTVTVDHLPTAPAG